MKQTFILIICTFFFFGCEKMFKYDKLNSLSLNSLDDYNVAITGLYSKLFNAVLGNDLIFIESIGDGDDIKVGKGSEARHNLNDNIFNNETQSGFVVDFTGPYKLFYQAIGCANDILSKTGNINKLNPGYRQIIGEVYFIRAYCYFKLARIYGQVPLVDNPNVNLTLAKPSFVQLYNFIIGDLLKSIDLLPNNNNEARVKYETPHKGTAKAMLAEVYLTMGGYPLNDNSKYAAAANVAKEVIDNSVYYGFALMPDIADLWNGTQERNPESEFSCYVFNYLIKPNQYIFFHFYPNNYFPYSSAPDFYDSFPKNYRKESCFQTRGRLTKYYWDSIKRMEVFYIDSTIIHFDTIDYEGRIDISYKKFYSQINIPDSILKMNNAYDLVLNYPYTGHVVYIFRYAQTLLTYAEAKARAVIVDDLAYNAINQIRRRANKIDKIHLRSSICKRV